MYLGFQNHKTSSEKGQEWYESLKQSTIDVFEIKIEQDRCRWCNYKLNCKKQHK